MKLMTNLIAATMVFGIAAPAFADYDYHDYRHDVREANRHLARELRRDAWGNTYSVRVAPSYYSDRVYYTTPYPSNYYYYGSRKADIVHGILDSIF
jgi:hypothetical protein